METLKQAKKRQAEDVRLIQERVTEIIEAVRAQGDETVRKFDDIFDKSGRRDFRVTDEEIKEAYAQLSKQELADLKKAADNIKAFAVAQKTTLTDIKEFSPEPGVILGHKHIPIESCCCYVPGGGYPLYSTALMLGIPAKVAGVKRIVACSPVMKGSGTIYPKTLVAMDLAGVDEIYALGGVQAIAAFAYGTETLRPVNLIVGPGNAYVAEAKRQCYGQVGIDFIAGPSEVLIIADGSANPEFLAADLLAQSEHDSLAKGILVTTDRRLGQAVIEEVERQLETLETAGIARQSWETYGEVLLAKDLDEAVNYSNSYAPEHLELVTKENQLIQDKLINYGSLFLGEYSAEVFGDYASGTNHTLPTQGAARYTGGVWVGTFLKTCTHQTIEGEAMKSLSPLVERLAAGEGLMAHSKAAKIRR